MSEELPTGAAQPAGEGGAAAPETGQPQNGMAAPAGDSATAPAPANPSRVSEIEISPGAVESNEAVSPARIGAAAAVDSQAVSSSGGEGTPQATALAHELLQMELPQRLRALQQMEARLADELREAGA